MNSTYWPCFNWSVSLFYYGSVWIQLILMKTENWKHYSKIIFKCVNSSVGPIFNFFFLNKAIVDSVNSAWIVLLFLETVKRVHQKKKGKENVKRKNARCRLSSQMHTMSKFFNGENHIFVLTFSCDFHFGP